MPIGSSKRPSWPQVACQLNNSLRPPRVTMVAMQQASTVAAEYAGGKMLASREGGIGVVTFNQPEKHNAISVEMWLGLAHILDEFAADDGIRIVILTGAGTRAFVSGADISQFE